MTIASPRAGHAVVEWVVIVPLLAALTALTIRLTSLPLLQMRLDAAAGQAVRRIASGVWAPDARAVSVRLSSELGGGAAQAAVMREGGSPGLWTLSVSWEGLPGVVLIATAREAGR